MSNETINSTASVTIEHSLANLPIFFQAIQWAVDFLLYHAVTLAVLGLIGVAFFVNNYGTKRNLQIATKAKNLIDDFLKLNFTNYSGELVDESPNIIKLYASGRESCIFGIFAFALIPRQQLASFLLNSIIFNVKDELVIQVPIKTSLTLTLAIVRKKDIRQITKKRYPDIKTLCKEYKPTNKTAFNVPETHAILVQRKQHVQYLIATEKQLQLWQEQAKFVKLVYLSDINKFSRYPMALRMVINLSEDDLQKQKGQGLIQLLDWMMAFVDRISKVRMPVADKRQAKKRREGIDDVYDQF